MSTHRVVFFFLLLLLAVTTPAQERGVPATAPPGGVIVKVRTALGGPLAGSAIVRLYDPVGAIELRESTRDGGEARFSGLPYGDYRIEVMAPGYDRSEESAEIVPGSTIQIFVTMRPEGTGAAASAPARGTVLTPKARKELEKAVADLNANNLKEARERLEKVAKMAPGHPEPQYLLAVAAFRANEAAAAEALLKNVLSLQPNNASAHSLMGRILLQRNDASGAAKSFESALAENPELWEASALLASASMVLGDFQKALTHAGRALENSANTMPQLRVLMAEALLRLGQNEKAATELERFLSANASHPAAPQARSLLSRARAAASPVAAKPPATSAPIALPPPVPKVTEGNWAPRDVDDLKPFVASDVSCALPDVMKAAGQRVTKLAENLQGVSATESVEFSELDENGFAKSVLTRDFDYMVSIQKVRGGLLSIEEMRNGRQGFDSFPTQLVTRGLAALALVFYPEYARDLEFRCEGLGQWKGQSVWQLYFKQRSDRENRVRSIHTRRGRFPVPLKGRVWVAANSYQILRLETDLIAPIEKAELEREHITVEYKPVSFTQRKLELWLPESAEMYAKLSGKRYRQRHQFTNFTYFSVDTKQKISDPKLPPEQNPPNLP